VASPLSARRAEMPAEPTQARRFGKARTAQSGALSEDYVELISDLLANGGEARPTDIARLLGVSHATAVRIVVSLLLTGGVPIEAAEQDVEGIEDHVSDTSLPAFGRFLRRHG
jgi:DtxR family transcriptional regulator, manganese transport regulator